MAQYILYAKYTINHSVTYISFSITKTLSESFQNPLTEEPLINNCKTKTSIHPSTLNLSLLLVPEVPGAPLMG